MIRKSRLNPIPEKRQAKLGKVYSSLSPGRRTLKKQNRKRRQSEFARCYHSKERVAWVKAQPCCVSGVRGDIENVHVVTDGIGRKAGYQFIVPMARELHRQLHRIGKTSFEDKWGVDMGRLAALTEAEWQAHTLGESDE